MDVIASDLVKKGYVAFAISYRLMTSANTNAEYEQGAYQCASDAKSAIRFLKRNHATYKIDTTKIFLFGSSAGAAGAATAAWNDTVTYFNTVNMPNTERAVAASIVSGFFAPDTILIRDGHPHGLVIHGKQDTTVPFVEGKKIELRLLHVGVSTKVDSLYFDNKAHGLLQDPVAYPQLRDRTVSFFKNFIWGGQY